MPTCLTFELDGGAYLIDEKQIEGRFAILKNSRMKLIDDHKFKDELAYSLANYLTSFTNKYKLRLVDQCV